MGHRSRVLSVAFVFVLAASLGGATGCRGAAGRGEARPEGSGASPLTRAHVGTDPGAVGRGTPLVAKPGHALAAFAAGCFWGVEDNFRQVPGVTATAVGYTGGRTKDPTYELVCTHTTGHAETVLVEYDPALISYEKLLDVFFANHDPTTENRQGPDVGDQYRSAVFTFDETQAGAARAKARASEEKLKKRVTTKIEPISAFYRAEEYHQQYDEKSGTHSCPTPKGL